MEKETELYLIQRIEKLEQENKELREKILPALKEKELYPYKLIWRNWKPVVVASHFKFKLTIINIGMFLSYPSETISYYKSQNNEMKEDEIATRISDASIKSHAKGKREGL